MTATTSVCLLLVVPLALALDCISRDFGQGSTVCVCNSTYCDDLEPVRNFPPRQYYIYTSSKGGLRFDASKKNFGTKAKTKGVSFTLNPDIEFQKVNGFGGAFTDAAGINIASLSEASQDKLLQSYFGAGGIGYTIGRVPIGGTDFSTRPYTYDDNPFDTGFLKFNLTDDDYLYKIPYIQKAKEMSNDNLRLLAAAWSAPPWMKTNDDYSGFGFLKDEYYPTWAKYHIKFLEKYDEHGIRFWAMSTGNEPINGAIPFFPFNCLGWTPMGQRTWVSQYLGPMLQRSPFNDTMILALDDQRVDLPWWISVLFQDKLAEPYISGIAVHWYWDNWVPIILLDKTHEAFPDKFLLSTEACFTKKKWEITPVHLGSWSRGEQYAESVLDDMNHWVTGWVDWNLALDEMGGPTWAENNVDSAIIVNATTDEFYKQPMFYALGHFSKFVPPGSVRIELTGGIRGVKGIAFHTSDDYIVVIILNKRITEQSISIGGAPRGGFANVVVPAKSITTIVCRDKKAPSYRLIHA